MELEEVKRKIEGEAELGRKMDNIRKKDIENLEGIYPSHLSCLLPLLRNL